MSKAKCIKSPVMYNKSEENIRHLASFPHFNPNPVIELDAQGKPVFCNQAVTQILERLGMPKDPGLFLPADFPAILKSLGAAEKKVNTREIKIQYRTFMETIVVLPELQVIRIYAWDITPLKTAEEQLRRTRDYLEKLLNYAHAPVMAWDRSMLIRRFNRSFERLTGYKEKEMKGARVSVLFPEESRQRSVDLVEEALSGKYWRSVEISILRKDGEKIIALWNSANIYSDDKQELIETVAQGQDITERKRAEELLLTSHEELEEKVQRRTVQLVELNKQLGQEILLRRNTEKEVRARNILLRLLNKASSLEAYADGIMKLAKGWSGCRHAGIRVMDEMKNIPYESCLGFTVELWGVKDWFPSEEAGHTDSDGLVYTQSGSFYCAQAVDLAGGLDEKKRGKFWDACLKGGYNSIAVIPLRYKNRAVGMLYLGDERLNALSLRTIQFIEAFTGSMADGIQKFNLENRVKREHSFLEAFYSHALTPLVFLDRNFNFIRVNRAYARACQRDLTEFIGRNHFELYPHKENEAIFRNVVAAKTPFQAIAKPFLFPDHPEWGVTYWDWTLFPIVGRNGEVDFLVFSLNNVTQRKKAEEELFRAQRELVESKRLSDIGALAATVAHELRNPLGVMRASAYNIRRKARNPLLDGHLDNINRKIQDADQIIDNLLFYSRLKQPRMEKVRLFDILNDCVNAMKIKHEKVDIRVSRKIGAIKEEFIDADPLQLGELFNNILNNAYDASFEGKKRILVAAQKEPQGAGIMVTITDQGEGMDRDLRARIFEPFFTTKAKGTGLGMTVCRQIVLSHRGSLDVVSEKNKGTTVIVTLPMRFSSDQKSLNS